MILNNCCRAPYTFVARTVKSGNPNCRAYVRSRWSAAALVPQEQPRPLGRPAHADHLAVRVVEQQVGEVLPGERIRAEDHDLVHATFRCGDSGRTTAASAARALASCAALRASGSAAAEYARRLPPTGR